MDNEADRKQTDALRALMRGVPRAEPDPGYVQRIMDGVAADRARRQRRRERWLLLWPSGASLALVALALWLGGYAGAADAGEPGRGLAEAVEAWPEELAGVAGQCGGVLREVGRMAAPWVGIMLVALLLLVFDHMMRRAYASRHR